MKKRDIYNAFKARLHYLMDVSWYAYFFSAGLEEAVMLEIAGGEIAWPNVGHNGGRPLFVVSFSGGDRTNQTLKGDDVRETGVFSVNIEVEKGIGEDRAGDYADAVASLFPAGLRLTVGDDEGQIVITKPPSIRAGYPDDTCWRVPVVVNYHANAAL